MSVFDRVVELGRAAAQRASERVNTSLEATRSAPLEEIGPEPPVVARLIVEIRSDGSRTIARGGLEDLSTGQKVAIRADGATPAALARSLAGTLVSLPLFAARLAQSLKHGKSPTPEDPEDPEKLR